MRGITLITVRHHATKPVLPSIATVNCARGADPVSVPEVPLLAQGGASR